MARFRDALKADSAPPAAEVVQTAYGPVEVRELTAGQFDEFLELVEGGYDPDPEKRRKVRVAAMVYCTAHDPDTGERAFCRDDVGWLTEQPFRRLAAVYHAANTLNQVEDPKKSSATPGDGTSGDSPAGSE